MSHKLPPHLWVVEEIDEMGGHDCMTAGLKVGPVTLDGRDYGQRACEPFSEDSREQMLADAYLIGAAPALQVALERTLSWLTSYPGGGTMGPTGPYEQARAALARCTPQPADGAAVEP